MRYRKKHPEKCKYPDEGDTDGLNLNDFQDPQVNQPRQVYFLSIYANLNVQLSSRKPLVCLTFHINAGIASTQVNRSTYRIWDDVSTCNINLHHLWSLSLLFLRTLCIKIFFPCNHLIHAITSSFIFPLSAPKPWMSSRSVVVVICFSSSFEPSSPRLLMFLLNNCVVYNALGM